VEDIKQNVLTRKRTATKIREFSTKTISAAAYAFLQQGSQAGIRHRRPWGEFEATLQDETGHIRTNRGHWLMTLHRHSWVREAPSDWYEFESLISPVFLSIESSTIMCPIFRYSPKRPRT
jgi:hypothetical protein